MKLHRMSSLWAVPLTMAGFVLACTDSEDDLFPDTDTDEQTDEDAGPDPSPTTDAGGVPVPVDPDASVPDGGFPFLDAAVPIDASLPPPVPDGGVLIPADAGVPDSGLPPITDAASDMNPEQELDLTFDFSDGAEGWEADFSDFFPDMAEGMELLGEFQSDEETPEDVGPAFTLQGTNHSDDLFMFMKTRLGPQDGIINSSVYEVRFEISFYSNAPSGCVGIGGPPGEAVYLKAGASPIEPEPVLMGDAGVEQVRMNVDKGNQASGGEAAAVVSDIANGIPCEEESTGYVLLTRTHLFENLVEASGAGDLWVFVGTDSGFEGRTELYIDSIRITATTALGQPE